MAKAFISIALALSFFGLAAAEAAPTKPAYFSAAGIAPDQINLIWLGSTTTTGSVASYTIRRDGTVIGTVTHTPYLAPYHDTEQQLFQDMHVTPGTSYAYTVTARDTAGNDSLPSDTVTVSAPLGAVGLIPSSRLANWTPGVTVGVPGGIPTNRTHLIDVTQPPYNADKTGATDASPAINSAIAAAAAGDVVFLPTGTYRISSVIYIAFKSNLTLRGAGMDNTVIDCRAGGCINVRGSSFYNVFPVPILSGATLGSNQVSVSDGSQYTIGNLYKISEKNDATLPVLSVSGFEDTRFQTVVLTGKSGNTLTFAPPLVTNFSATHASITTPVYPTSKYVGIEDLTVDGSNALPQVGIGIGGTYGAWVKNVKIKAIGNYSLSIAESVGCEVRHSYLDELNHGGTNGAGLLMGASTGCLIEDNVVLKSFPLFEINASSTGNVFAYNYLPDGSVNTNHGPHNSFNLYEGNFLNAGEFKSDGYFGSDSEEMFFRNWTSGFFAFKRFTRKFSAIGNVVGAYSLGQPNIGNGSSSGYVLPSRDLYWEDWSANTGLGIKGTLTTRTSDTTGIFTISAGDSRLIDYCRYFGSGYCLSLSIDWGSGRRYGMAQSSRSGNMITIQGGYGTDVLPAVGTEVGFWPRSEGFQELDMDVALTLMRKGNNVGGTGIPANEVLPAGQSLPESLYLSTKPDWFGTLTWPPVNPTIRGGTTVNSIPAGYRFNHPGQEAPGIGSTPTCTSFTYAAWGPCVAGQQRRNVIGATPSECTGGTPLTLQSCIPGSSEPSAPTRLHVGSSR